MSPTYNIVQERYEIGIRSFATQAKRGLPIFKKSPNFSGVTPAGRLLNALQSHVSPKKEKTDIMAFIDALKKILNQEPVDQPYKEFQDAANAYLAEDDGAWTQTAIKALLCMVNTEIIKLNYRVGHWNHDEILDDTVRKYFSKKLTTSEGQGEESEWLILSLEEESKEKIKEPSPPASQLTTTPAVFSDNPFSNLKKPTFQTCHP